MPNSSPTCIRSAIPPVRVCMPRWRRTGQGPRPITGVAIEQDQTARLHGDRCVCPRRWRHCRQGPDGRRRRDVRQQEYHPECDELQGSHHAGRRGQGGRAGGDTRREGAFAALPPGTVDTLLKPENKATLDKILTYHVVPGRLDSKALDQKIKSGGGKAMLKTVQGDMLTVSGSGTNLTVTDDKGNSARVTIPDVYQSNGVILVVNKVLMPG